MHGTVPVLRTVSAIASQSPSKIPHLTFHIVQRRATKVNLRSLHASSLTQQHRDQSTTAHLEDYKLFGTAPEHRDARNKHSTRVATNVSDTNVRVLRTEDNEGTQRAEDINFYSILEQDSPELVLLALCNETIGDPFVRDAPDDLFTKALLLVDPDQFIAPHKRIYRYLKNQEEEPLQFRGLRHIEDRSERYVNLFFRIIELRHEGKHRLNQDSCKHLLRWAASLGHERLAAVVFDEVMKADSVEPDVECYNYYMEAMNWSHAYSQAEKFALRILPIHLKLRGLQTRPAGLSGYRTENLAAGSVGIRGEILQSFGQLVQDGHKANTHTFINLMIAMGREGDIKGVTSILKSVWNIDIGLLEQYDEDEIESPTFYEEGHHLRPGSDLLFALAHIFGSNNDARTAWTLVDYVSRNYAIPIRRYVWTELLEWYMVLSLRRGGSARNKGFTTGQISGEVFEQLFATMMDQPHSVRPDSAAYYIQSRVRMDRRHLEQQVESVSNICNSLNETSAQMHDSMRTLCDYIYRECQNPLPHLWNRTDFHRLRQRFIIDSLEFEACLSMTRHAVVQRLLRQNYWPGGRKEKEWERRRLPQLISKFAAYLPESLQYRTSCGVVELKDKEYGHHAAREPHTPTYRFMTRLRAALDTEDHDALLAGVQQFLESGGHYLHAKQKYIERVDVDRKHVADSAVKGDMAESSSQLGM